MVGRVGHAVWVVLLTVAGLWFGLAPEQAQSVQGQVVECGSPWVGEHDHGLCRAALVPGTAAAWLLLTFAALALVGLVARMSRGPAASEWPAPNLIRVR